MVERQVNVLIGQRQGRAHLVAQQPTALARQRAGAVKAAHGVSPANAEAVLRGQHRAVVLPAPVALVLPALAPQLKWRAQLHIGRHQTKAVRAFAKQLFRRLGGAKGLCAALVVQASFDLRRAPLGFVLQAQLKAAHAAALHLDFGVVDEVLRLARKGFDAPAAFADRVAVKQVGELDVLAVAHTAVHIVLGGAGHRLKVAIAAGVHPHQPVAHRHAVVGRDATGAAPAGVATAQVARQGDVQQIVERERVVVAQCGAALVFAAAVAAAVVGAQVQAPELGL